MAVAGAALPETLAAEAASAADAEARAEPAADAAAEPVPVRESDSETLADGDARLVLGVTRDGCTVLDGAALLADPRLNFGTTRSR